MNYKLHYAPDNASLIIRIFLEEIEAKYTCNLIDRKQNSQKDPKYLALNPNGLIPVLETNYGPIFETAAILLFLGILGLVKNDDENITNCTTPNWIRTPIPVSRFVNA